MLNNLENIKIAYLIGIKGVGMTALAQILQSRGVRVLGSDVKEKFFTDEVLNKLNIPFQENFSKKNIPHYIDVVIHSQAYNKKNNIEVAEVLNRELKVITYSEALAELFNNSYGIAIAGSHGKSTTTAMLGYILECAQFDPTVVVGSRVNSWGSNARAGKSKYFIIEADEYQDVFLQYYPKMIVLTNIDYDHPDYFKTEKDYKNSFEKFIDKVSVNKLVLHRNVGSSYNFNLKMLGDYNQENAYLAYTAAIKLGVNKNIAKKALKNFSGLARRFEYYGKYNGAELYDDYAHHPTEIKALLRAIKEKYSEKKIIAIFQPHTFTRTKELFHYFIKSFNDANKVYVLKTYTSVRETGEDIWGKKLAAILDTKYFENHKEALDSVKKELNKKCVLITIGAGDAWQILDKIK